MGCALALALRWFYFFGDAVTMHAWLHAFLTFFVWHIPLLDELAALGWPDWGNCALWNLKGFADGGWSCGGLMRGSRGFVE